MIHLDWCKRAERHGIHPEIVAAVHDRTMKRVRSDNWSNKTTARATAEAVRLIRRIKQGDTHLYRRKEKKGGPSEVECPTRR